MPVGVGGWGDAVQGGLRGGQFGALGVGGGMVQGRGVQGGEFDSSVHGGGNWGRVGMLGDVREGMCKLMCKLDVKAGDVQTGGEPPSG